MEEKLAVFLAERDLLGGGDALLRGL